MIYVASPYTHENEEVMKERYEAAVDFCARAILQGFHVFSPIIHCHPLAVAYNLPRDFPFWTNWNITMMKACQNFWILTLPGFELSTGIKVDTAIAQTLDCIETIEKVSFDKFICKKGDQKCTT